MILLSCHQTLIRLGDLSRWRETQLATKGYNWGPSIGFYELARLIYPASGVPHSQLAVIALVEANHLRVVYHLYRALTTEEPHPNAQSNIEIEFNKIQGTLGTEEEVNSDDTRDMQGSEEPLVRWLVYFHARCYSGVDIPNQDQMEGKVIESLASNLKERPLEGTFGKIVLINIAAEYFAGIRLKGSHPRIGCHLDLSADVPSRAS